MFDLVRENMQYHYKLSGWDFTDKLTEIKQTSHFLILYQPNCPSPSTSEFSTSSSLDSSPLPNSFNNTPIGFISFREEYAEDDETPVVYLYEIQLEKSKCQKGYGTRLYLELERVAVQFQFPKLIMCTVQLSNLASL